MPEAEASLSKSGFVVAIDGPAGAGKSTLARALARRLGLPYVNTGLMYRALAARALAEGTDPGDGPVLSQAARGFTFSLRSEGNTVELAIDGAAPGRDLTSPPVEAVVSAVAAHPEVRRVLRAEQRALGARGCVMEGRDIGSVVFPDADAKIFLSALPDERARRRRRERGAAKPSALARRDEMDSRTNPLRPTADAIVLDTTELAPGEALERAWAFVEKVRKEARAR